MSEGYIASDILKDIEDSIKYKLGTQDDYSPPEMPGAIMSIPQEIDARVGEKDIIKNGVYDASDDYLDGYNHVNVRVPAEEGGGKILPVLKNLDVSENGSYDASEEGADGYDVVNVNVPPVPARLLEVRIEENGVIDPPEGYDGFSKLRVSVLSDANINEKPNEITENGTYEAIDDGLDGYSKVTVNLNIQNEKELTQNGTFYPDGTNSGVYKMNVNVNPPLEDVEFTSNGNYTPTGTNYGFGSVNVNVPNPPLEQALFTTNGVYFPSGTNYGFSEVNVSVPLPTLEEKFITSNGDYYPSGSNYGFSHVNVNVPGYVPVLENREFRQNGSYTPSPGYDGFFKVDVNVPQTATFTSKTFTSNGQYNANTYGFDGFNQVNVNVPIQDSKSLSVSYGTTTINPDGTNVAMGKVIVTTPAQPTFGFKEFTSNGLYNANSYGLDGFNQININVPSGGPSMNVNKVVFYKSGSTNVLINDNRYVLGGYPTFGFDYSGITKVYVGDAIVDGSHMFENTNINAGIDHSIGSSTGEFYDYSYMFNNCQLFNNYLPFFEIRNAVSLEYMFCDCVNYDYAGIPIASTYPGYTNVSAESMFRNCTKLYSVEVPINMSISGLYDCSNMFRNCTSYSRDVNFPNCIKEAKYMFSECTSFNGNIKFNLSATYMNINNMAYMFNGCKNFNSNFVNVTNLGSNSFYMMFANCHNFSKYVPNLYSGSYGLVVDHCLNTCRMFINCYKFNQKINICSHSINTNVSNMFLNCNNMNSFVNIYLSGAAKFIAIDMFMGCNNFKSNVYILKAGDTDIIQNSSYLFTSSIYNRNIQASSQPYRMNIICGSTNIYNAFLRDMSLPPTWTTFSDGVYNSKYNVYVYNHL